jgi:HEAT repeat protein
MFTDKNEGIRRRAATCIGWLGQEELAVELLPLLDDNRVSVRRAAVEAMGNLRSRQVVSSLIEQLNDPVVSIRKVVSSALEKITGKKMSKSFPKNEEGFEHLTARWQEWWKEEILG